MELNMAYKTLMLQIYKPSGHKRALIDIAILRYSRALQALLDRYRDELIKLSKSEVNVTRSMLLSLIDKDTVKDLNDFNVQPFKDSLKIDFAFLAATFIAQSKKNRNTGYPCVFLDPLRYCSLISDIIKQFDDRLICKSRFEYEYSKITSHVDRLHPLYFGRYSAHRDFCLLYDEFTGRFYAKLYLVNLADSIYSAQTTGKLSLKYVTAGMPAMLNQSGKKRYIVVPLAFGKSQQEYLKHTLDNPSIIHTARLLKKGNKYYLMVNVDCATEHVLTTSTTMGVARNSVGGLHYTICDESGGVVSNGNIGSNYNESQMPFFFSKNIVKIAFENKSQVVLESNGGKNDEVLFKKDTGAEPLTAKQYSSLAEILKYKLDEKRLPPPIEVSANGLYCTCPLCEKRTRKNCISSEIFACVECGYASISESIGSINLAQRLIKYRSDKVPVYVSESDNGLMFYNKCLNFECMLPKDCSDYTQMYYELNLLVHCKAEFESNSKIYSILKKLRESPNIKDTVRIVSKGQQN
jgi:putative transposase